MGNLCGKPSKKDNFSSPGRVIGAPPPPNPAATAKIPPPPKKSGDAPAAPRPLAGGSETDARRKAAEAAEARAQAASKSTHKGKLSGQLAEQKKQTRTDTLNAVSEENRRARDLDASKDVVNYN